jgi:hypothetical protein
MFDARFAKYLNDPERDLHDLMVDVCAETLALAERARDEALAERGHDKIGATAYAKLDET